MAQIELFLLGPPRILIDERRVEVRPRKAMALLAYLAVTGRPHRREALATLLWPDAEQGTALGRLRRTLYRLGQAVGSDVVRASHTMAEIDPRAELWLDTDRFRRLLVGCLPDSRAAPAPDNGCAARLAAAVELYADDLMAGFTLPDSPDFDEWQFFEAESLRDALGRALAALVEVHEAGRAWDVAIDYARRQLALDPLEEASHRRLMRLYAAAGRRAAALRQYAECERILQQELDVAPGEETVALREAIRSRWIPARSGGPRAPGRQPAAAEPDPGLEPGAGAVTGPAPCPPQDVPLRDKNRSWTGYAPAWSETSPTWPPASWSGTRRSHTSDP